ncbi:hypothetical protein X729_00555 [Mesorhizobium sp. L103C131B0]|nr:hypothetical protein X729_00555 [Mesorhizobium sp. L103C131B0]
MADSTTNADKTTATEIAFFNEFPSFFDGMTSANFLLE